ncbi:MAG: phosphoglycerate dehydrogenase [Alphaproteobacteria bacterium]|nr:phosphoglycerate dehydrogenase [Alphaproteobacteria bacterium]
MPKVLISDKLSEKAVAVFEDRGITVDFRPGLSAEELLSVIGAYDGLAIRSATKVTGAVLDAGPGLKVVGRAGIGVDNVDVPAATARGVVVMNTPFGNSITTAEHAIAMMFALARQIPEADASTQAGKWEKSKFMGTELTGKTLGVIGCGNIGAIVCSRALGLKMRVMAYDPYLSDDRAADLGVRKTDLDPLLAEADIVTLHVPLTDQTRNLLSRERLATMKPGARLINCARGGLVDETALKEMLETGHLAGAALDVFAEEPARDNPLFGAPNLIATPHLGAATAEAQEKVAIQVAEQMSDYLLTGAVTNAVNMASVSAEEAPKLKPYLDLAEKLGAMLGQLARQTYDEIEIEFEGHAADLNTKPVTAAALTGLLRPQVESVNPVSAPVLARERDIDLKVATYGRECDYQTLIRIKTHGMDRDRSAAGTLVGGTRPRITELMGIPLEAEFGTHMLLVRNKDKPGFIGALGSLLADREINIGTFHLGRAETGGDAVALVNIDTAVTRELADAVAALPHVQRVIPLSF